MNAEEYGAMKQRLIAAVPRHSITINLPKTLVIQAGTGGYLRFNHMVMDPELLEGLPQMTIDMLHNKLLVQFGSEADGDSWINLGRTLAGHDNDIPELAKWSLGWLSKVFKIQEFFEV